MNIKLYDVLNKNKYKQKRKKYIIASFRFIKLNKQKQFFLLNIIIKKIER